LLNTIFGTISEGAPPFVAGNYDSISTVTVGSGGSSSIDFTSIPSTYTHLQIRGIARSTLAGTAEDNILIRLNSDTGSNYSAHALAGDGSVVYIAAAAASQTSGFGAAIPRAGVTSGVFGAFVYDLLDYANTNKYKTIRYVGSFDRNGGGNVIFGSAAWLSTSATTSITMFPAGGSASFPQYSQFALYGIKGS
jgi:hypothetical protein